jgi:cysteine desulfurase/selenocysteine lyase
MSASFATISDVAAGPGAGPEKADAQAAVGGVTGASFWRMDFPILHTPDLVYLDNAATTQKPTAVIEAEATFYASRNANVHRGVHRLSLLATEAYEAARVKTQRFINAASEDEVVFVRGATEGINLVAQSYARPRLGPGDEVLVTVMEHHSNIVPWQVVCEQTGAALKTVPITDAGELELAAFERLIGRRTRLVALTQLSNALGTIVPIRRLAQLARAAGVPVLVDGAQAVSHLPVDVQAIGCDFYVFSGHKVFGPTGIGVLYGRAERLESMAPYQVGGDMIRSVSFEKTEYDAAPRRFEAGTPNVAGAVGLGAALDYVSAIGLAAIAAHEKRLLDYATRAVADVPGLRIVGTAPAKASILSFTLENVHPHDIGTILDHYGIAIRAGHHCAMPVMRRYGIDGTARASFALYNTLEEVDALVDGIHRIAEMFRP